MQVGFAELEVGGGLLSIYYFDGKRYQHWARIASVGFEKFDANSDFPNVCIAIEDSETDEDVGQVKLFAENEKENEILRGNDYHDRNKESDYFIFLPRQFEKQKDNTFQHWRNGW